MKVNFSSYFLFLLILFCCVEIRKFVHVMIEDHANLQSTLEQHLQNSVQVPCLLICDDLLAATNPASLDYLGKPSKKKINCCKFPQTTPTKYTTFKLFQIFFLKAASKLKYSPSTVVTVEYL